MRSHANGPLANDRPATPRLKVLLSAYACEPNRGSEPGIGWNWALQAAKHHEVWVLTRSNNRPSIESELAEKPVPNLHFLYYDLPRFALRLKRYSGTIRPYYLAWQFALLNQARAAHAVHGFDLVHHITFNPIDVPGLLWRLPIPFVWGPVGGAQVPPSELRFYYGSAWKKEQLRFFRKRTLRFDPLVRLAVRRSAHIIAANRDTERALRSLGADRVSRLLEAGRSVEMDASDAVARSDGRFRVVWVGTLQPRKAPMLALDVLERVRMERLDVNLVMIGDGPLRGQIDEQIRIRGLESYVEIIPKVEHSRMAVQYQTGDVFLFSSLQDTSGNVVLEAMASRLPVVALNHQGVAEMVTPECGTLVDIHSREQVLHDLSGAILALAANPQQSRKMGEAGRERVRTVFSWDRKGEFIDELYRRVVAESRAETSYDR